MTAMRLKRYPSPSGGFALGKMGVGATMLKQGKTAKDYVQDGLIAMWDGVENAGRGTHDPGATTWKNLCGTADLSDATITPGQSITGWSDTALVLPGVVNGTSKNIAMQATSLSGRMQGDGYTLEACGKATLQSLTQTSMWPALASLGNIGSRVILGVQNRLAFSDAIASTRRSYWLNDTLAPIQSRQTFTLVHPTGYSSRTVYVSGKAIGGWTKQSYESNGDTILNVNIGLHFYTTGEEINCIRLYSRALTADEIARNYAIDKERFNLL